MNLKLRSIKQQNQETTEANKRTYSFNLILMGQVIILKEWLPADNSNIGFCHIKTTLVNDRLFIIRFCVVSISTISLSLET